MLESEFTDNDRVKFWEQTIKRNKNVRLHRKTISQRNHVTMNMVIKNEGNMCRTICDFLVVEGERVVEVVISGIYRADLAKNGFQMRDIKFYPVWKN